MSILSDFFAPLDAERLESLKAQALDTYGLDVSGVYCLHTGKQVGSFHDSELIDAIDEIGADTDDESIVDDLVVRVIASMRPSLTLNKPNHETIRQMVLTRPVDALAYLANRLVSNRHLAVHRVPIIAPYLQRIAIHRQWTRLAAAGVDLTPWIHWLLVIDANQNLHDVSPPVDSAGTFLLQLVDTDNHESMFKQFHKWVESVTAAYETRQKELVAQQAWAQGNKMTRSAATQSWKDNPQFMRKPAPKAKPGRKAESPKTQKLNSEVSQFMDLLDDVFSGKIKAPSPAPSSPRVKTAAAFNFNFAKKGA